MLDGKHYSYYHMTHILKKGVLVRKQHILSSLGTDTKKGKKLYPLFASPGKINTLPFSILEDCQVTNEPEVHHRDGDLWYCLEGASVFQWGGKLIKPRPRINPDGTKNKDETSGARIAGGRKATLKSGDWLWIPAGVPHQHSAKKTARLVIIKVPSNV